MNRKALAAIAIGLTSLTGCQIRQVHHVTKVLDASTPSAPTHTSTPNEVELSIIVANAPAATASNSTTQDVTARAEAQALTSFRELQAKICMKQNRPDLCP